MNSRIKEDVSRLFEYWCEIAPGHPASANGSSPSSPPGGGGGGGGVGENRTSASPDCGGYIVHSFPESFKEAKVIADIPSFAFPCNFERKTIQVHSFVLTNIDSKWRFGFCRHDPKSPTAMVIVTYLPWHDTFIRFLNVLADVRKNSQSEFESFLSEAYNKGIPEPGGCLKFQYDRPVQTFSFQRPQQFLLPSIPENHNLNLYYNFVDPKFMIGIFAAMLAERRIIFVSQQLDRLSSCIQAANAFLYPMVWQHIFIPVLPSKMRDILGAPMPFLIGVPEPVYASLRREEVGEVVILNCDKRTLETPFDDVKNMPPELVASLKKHLSNQTDHRGDRVSKIFLGILVQLIGGYRDAVKFNDKITFDPETFIDTRPSHLRPFLTKMLQLQIFQQFIEERLDMLNTGQGFSDEFELECSRYAEKSGRKVKQYKDLLKNFKDKTNPAVRSAVKSVKEGGKGVKTAYKGLRSKFRETTPPKSKMDSSMHSHVSQYDIGHQSAPNSPVFNKRPQTIALPSDSYSNHAQMLTPSSTSLFNSPHIMMAGAGHNNYNTITGCSSSNYNGTTNTSSSHNNNNHHHHGSSYNTSSSDVRSPSLSLSPTSSNSSSEMNILQELQQFDLFKSPAVNRNSANVDVADATHSNATNSKPSKQHCKSAGDDDEPPDDSSQDLINLDTTNNSSSFELEDFDPLNDNAKPIPIAAPRSTLTALTPGTPPAVLGFNNPIYPYFTPPHLHSKLATSSPLSSSLNNGGGGTLKHFSTTALQPPHHQLQHHHHQHSLSLGGGMFRPTEGATAIGRPQPSYSGSGATGHNSCAQDDFELLRNYGLDKFSLLDSASVGKTNQQQQQQHHMSSLFAAAGSSAAAIAAAKKQQQQQQQQIGDRSTGFVNSPLNGHGSNSNSNNYNNGASKQFTNWTTFD
ncbi:DENN domain-containing protein 1C isoform X3 [Uranotaenia lowii]|uniref:DENN domain-containing protein 1C isoform X3 n=1 Tax=Uranotaenia lowii TaxID=190385 RepID=UPI002478C8DD|nr:DENN domain-containing protein 1C isoform X3 [Uranotaenia lowii]